MQIQILGNMNMQTLITIRLTFLRKARVESTPSMMISESTRRWCMNENACSSKVGNVWLHTIYLTNIYIQMLCKRKE